MLCSSVSPCSPFGFSPGRGDSSLRPTSWQSLLFIFTKAMLLNVIFQQSSCLQPTPVLQQTPPRQSCTFLLAANICISRPRWIPCAPCNENTFRSWKTQLWRCLQKSGRLPAPLQAESPSQHQLPEHPWSPVSLLCKEEQMGSRELCPGGVGEQANRAPQQQDLVRGDSQQVLCLLIDRVEYSAVQAEPNYLAWKIKLLSAAAKLNLCHQGVDLKFSNPELYIWILPASLLACCPKIWAKT